MKAGVIGLGFMGAAHVAAIAADANAELVAVATNNPKAREGDLSETGGNLNLGDRKFDFSNVSKYSTWDQLIADPNVEAVSVCLPSNLHAQVSNAALAAGKHVLCEKPMALTLSDCESMISAATSANRTLMIAQVLRFWPEYRKLREFVMEGEHGKVRQATFVRKCGAPAWSKWLTDDSVSGGAVMDLLVHDIDQILLLFGMPARVTAKRIGDADTLMASFLYPGGPEVRLHGGWFEPGMPFAMSFQVRAEKGEMELTGDGLMLNNLSGVREKVEVPEANAYSEEVHYFLECCRTGAKPTLCLPADSLKAVNVALALKESRSKDGEQIQCLV